MAEITQPIDKPLATETRETHWVHLVPSVLIILIIAAVVTAIAAFEIFYSDRIYPGVSIWGIELGGLTREEAAALVETSFPYPNQPAITLRDGEQVWKVRPAQVGARLDARAATDAAYNFGRAGDLLERLQTHADIWRNGRQVSPVMVFDAAVARAYLNRLAATVNRPAQDAGLRLNGTTVITTPAVPGRSLDIEPVVLAMQEAIGNMQPADIALPFRPIEPNLPNVDIPRRELEKLLGSPLELVELSGSAAVKTWPIPPETLARLVILHREGDDIQVKLDETQLHALLAPIAPSLVITPVNGRYVFDDATARFIPISHSIDGRELDISGTIARINQQAFTDNRRVPLAFRAVKARYNDETRPQDLGITQLVAQGVTFFKGSSATRIKNIKVAASKFHGVIIEPGATFSFNQYLGDVTPEEGYEKALIIYEGRTIEGVGGGVCQVSTTAFRAAFEGGFPIVERWPHAYRVGWYERGPDTGFKGPGLDATVYAPLVDFKFLNDTPYHLLIETYTNEKDGILTFKFYSTSDGRKVTIEGPIISNIKPHGPDIYEEDPTLPPGAVKQVDWAVDGADVLVKRTVERNGVIILQDQVFTRYQPWQAIFKVGPQPPPEATPTP